MRALGRRTVHGALPAEGHRLWAYVPFIDERWALGSRADTGERGVHDLRSTFY